MADSDNSPKHDSPPQESDEPPASSGPANSGAGKSEESSASSLEESSGGGSCCSHKSTSHDEDMADRRGFLAKASTVGMAGGLLLGYGKFGELAGRYLYPPDMPPVQMFVATVGEIEPGSSFSYETPDGIKIVITRQEGSSETDPKASDFLALSSTCPHLGCRVHWEAHNDRFFCPCHNGAFDPTGKPLAGPPFDADQHLDQYTLLIEGNLLFIELPTGGVRA